MKTVNVRYGGFETEQEVDEALYDAIFQQGRADMFAEIKMLFRLAISEKPSRTINEAEAEIILRNVEKQIKEQKNE